MTNVIESCPIWGADHKANGVREVRNRLTRVTESLRTGGSYQITFDVQEDDIPGLSVEQKARLTTWLIGQRLAGNETPLVTRNIVSHTNARNPLPAHQRADRLLRYIAKNQKSLGDFVKIPADDAAEALAWSDSTDWEEVHFLLTYLQEMGWVTTGTFEKNFFTGHLTVEGHSRIEEISVNEDSSQAFVAMWFDPSMTETYESGIKVAIESTGYKPLLISEKPDVDKIDDEIIGEIRRSRFIVADFTHGEGGARGGVYYEAGFAYGLDIPVMRSCRKDIVDRNELHFDVRQHYHVIWETIDELRNGLEKRIRALLPDGPETTQRISQTVQ